MPLRQFNFTGHFMKTALITGAGSGIGKACALALLQDGWKVVLTGRRQEPLLRVAEESKSTSGQAIVIACDVADADQVQALFAKAKTELTHLDLLFNNAGIFPPAALPGDLALQDWRNTVDINLNGAYYCLAEAFKWMREQSPQGGRIINNGSISAHVPRPGSIAYAATKHAISGMTRAASLDGRAFDIAVGQIDIGNVTSDMTEHMVKGVPQADGSLRAEARMDMTAVTDAFMTMARMPLSANVLFMTVMATKMPFVGRG
jgi:NAD(P)-dependent dehydrogenase (short-subunit alcohol dehydrogenase family)